MPWNDIARAEYAPRSARYASDLGSVDIQDSHLPWFLIQASKRGGLTEPEQIYSHGSSVDCS